MSREFRRLADEHGGRIYTLALYLLGRREDAEDVTQEVLVRLWRYRDRIDPARTRAWVAQVTRNLVIDVSRQKRMRAAVFADGADMEETVAASVDASPDRAVMNGELRTALEAAIARLDEPYRSILVMREIQDYSYQEIASVTSMPLGTVKVYLHRARRRVRDVLRTGAHDGAD
ncbi:MAG: sigma-70 family RNA polymerase sigma factor [Candidatus Latescibacteria bacterium]|nr:sigma-70 family RNA polymerase sigma factor [Candidatus Latescibacterota bacterium]